MNLISNAGKRIRKNCLCQKRKMSNCKLKKKKNMIDEKNVILVSYIIHVQKNEFKLNAIYSVHVTGTFFVYYARAGCMI